MQQNSQLLACPQGSKENISFRGMLQITQLSKVNSIGFISFKSSNIVVGESDGVAEVCLMLNIPPSADLTVTVTCSETGHATGKNANYLS